MSDDLTFNIEANTRTAIVTDSTDDSSSNHTYQEYTLGAGTSPQVDDNDTSTARELALTDFVEGTPTTIWMKNASASVLTIPADVTVDVPIGGKVNIMWDEGGAGQPSITAAATVDLNGITAGSGVISDQYQGVTLSKRASNVWVATGNIGTVA